MTVSLLYNHLWSSTFVKYWLLMVKVYQYRYLYDNQAWLLVFQIITSDGQSLSILTANDNHAWLLVCQIITSDGQHFWESCQIIISDGQSL